MIGKWMAILTLIGVSVTGYGQSVRDLKFDKPSVHLNRKEMLDVLRELMKKDLEVDVVYSVHHFKLSNDWAWLMADTRRADGKPIELKENFLDCCHVEALFQRVNGTWQAVDWAAFSTDVWWQGIADRHPSAPKVIFDKAALLKSEEPGEEVTLDIQ